MSQKKIIIKDLKKSFNGKKILNGVNIEIEQGECFVIIGGSGCGKSVLIKNIAQLMTPDSGEVLIDNKNIFTAKNRDKKAYIDDIGYLFQGGALFDSFNIWQNVAFKLLQKKEFSYDVIKKKAIATLKDVGLGARIANLYPSELSGGMLKRASLARAVIAKPKIIFFDEPTTGLDPIMAEVIDDLIYKYAKELGATTITITHDMTTVQKISDKIAMLKDGKISWYGTNKQLKTTKDPDILKFLTRKI